MANNKKKKNDHKKLTAEERKKKLAETSEKIKTEIIIQMKDTQ